MEIDFQGNFQNKYIWGIYDMPSIYNDFIFSYMCCIKTDASISIMFFFFNISKLLQKAFF